MRWLLALALFLVSCGGANQAFLDRDWERFEQECVEYCAPAESHPEQAVGIGIRMWTCGCDAYWDE